MTRKKGTKRKYLELIKNDYAFRTFFFSALSFLVGAAYAVFNFYLGLKYKTAWNFGIAAY